MGKRSFFNWFQPLSIRHKVLIFGVAMSTIPLLLISYFYYTQVKEDLESRIIEKQELITKNLSNEIKLDFNQTFQQLQMFTTLRQLQDKKGFYELLQQNDSVEEVVITNEHGHVTKRVSRYELNLPGEEEGWYTDELWHEFLTEERVISEVQFNPYGQPVIKLAIPFYENEERIGIGVVVQLQKMIGQISSLRQDDSSYLYLVDRNGKIIAHQDYSKLYEEGSKLAKEDVLSVRTNIDQLNWTLVMEQPRRTADAPINKMFQIGLSAVAIGILLISLISVYAGLYFTKPIVQLDHAMKRLQLGHKTKPIQIKSNDELGKLAETFNEMTKEIQEKSLQLEMEKERLNVVVNGIGAGLALITKDYLVTWMNPILKRWLDREELSFPCYSIIGGYDEPCKDCPITCEDLIESSKNKTMKLKTVNGYERIFQHRVFPLSHSMSGEGEFLLVIEDITEQREMEEKIIQTDKLSALGLMASSFAHEVNNPLTTINVYAEDLNERFKLNDEDLSAEEIGHYLTKIVENTERCKRITNSLLNFSRKSNWHMGIVDVRETIQNSLSLVEHTLLKKKIEVELDIEAPLPEIRGDSLKLMQVMVNLIQNSIDAVEEGGKITITAQNLNDEMRLVFSDTGCGIHEQDLSKVLDPFYTTKPIGKGTGLGLSVCYGIVQQYGGNLEIESELGKGTSITITIPIKEETKWAVQEF